MEDLSALYQHLPVVYGSDDSYSTHSVGGRDRYKVGRDPSGNPALLIAAEPCPAAYSVLPLAYSNLSFRPRCQCLIKEENIADAVQTLAVLKCTTDDSVLRDYFLRSLSGTIESLPDVPTEEHLVDAVSKLVELFRALDAPPRTSLQGLWCELFLISGALKIRQAALAWHADPNALYDFTAGRQRVEVKSVIGPHRKHQFNLDQLLPQEGSDVLIASFVLEESGRGLSIAELWADVSTRSELTPEARNRLLHILTLGLGRDWRKADRVAFDPHNAAKGMRLYEATLVPKVAPNLPVEVSDVHFSSELTDVPALSRPDVTRKGGLFEALFQNR